MLGDWMTSSYLGFSTPLAWCLDCLKCTAHPLQVSHLFWGSGQHGNWCRHSGNHESMREVSTNVHTSGVGQGCSTVLGGSTERGNETPRRSRPRRLSTCDVPLSDSDCFPWRWPRGNHQSVREMSINVQTWGTKLQFDRWTPNLYAIIISIVWNVSSLLKAVWCYSRYGVFVVCVWARCKFSMSQYERAKMCIHDEVCP